MTQSQTQQAINAARTELKTAYTHLLAAYTHLQPHHHHPDIHQALALIPTTQTRHALAYLPNQKEDT